MGGFHGLWCFVGVGVDGGWVWRGFVCVGGLFWGDGGGGGGLCGVEGLEGVVEGVVDVGWCLWGVVVRLEEVGWVEGCGGVVGGVELELWEGDFDVVEVEGVVDFFAYVGVEFPVVIDV